MRGLMFQPPDRPVEWGDTISWVNHDIVPHTVTGVNTRWDSGEIPPGGSFTLVAEGADTMRYRCRYHPMMIGNLIAPATIETLAPLAGSSRSARTRQRPIGRQFYPVLRVAKAGE
jgi:hypothetical protein